MSDNADTHGASYKQYAVIWAILLLFTVTMIFIGEADMATGPQTLLLLLGSATKASLIIFFYMHLKYEKMPLIVTVLVGIFVTSILMFVIPAYDAGNVRDHTISMSTIEGR